jgi:hypothetical protein
MDFRRVGLVRFDSHRGRGWHRTWMGASGELADDQAFTFEVGWPASGGRR